MHRESSKTSAHQSSSSSQPFQSLPNQPSVSSSNRKNRHRKLTRTPARATSTPSSSHKGRYIVVAVILITTILAAFLGVWLFLDAEENKRLDAESIILKDNLTIEFGKPAQVSDFLSSLQGELVEDFPVSTNQLGDQEIHFEYINKKHRKRPSKFTIKVIDSTPPIIYGNSTYIVNTGSDQDLTDLMISIDNVDDSPHREIIGRYDLNTPGNYNLEYSITDASGNQTRKPFTLRVVNPNPNANSSTDRTSSSPFLLSDVIKKYRTSKTKIGIDVSAWQGQIDWPAVKKSGVEFAILRLGYQTDFGGEYTLDRYYQTNVAGATAAGVPIGVYFYSYASSLDEAKQQAAWIKDQIVDYDIELGVAFDWENWSDLNHAHMSLYTINQVAGTFLGELTGSGYEGLLYSSKVYLERIWQPQHPVWLAQYYDHPTYEGDFQIWQMSDSGRVDGIDGNVDLDIMYLE